MRDAGARSAARPTIAEIRAAARQLEGVLRPTSLLPPGDTRPGIWLKPEVLQAIGSFKIRGVHHAVARMSPEERAPGLETVSAGNTAQALAWSGRHFGVPARSVMPEDAPRTKIEAVRALGGTPVLVPTEEVFRFLRERLWEQDPYAFVHPWTDRDVWIGHGTLGLEIAEELPGVETVYVPVGGGGLLAGVGCALAELAPRARIVAVEPAGCPALFEARRRGAPVEVACRTMCDGVAVPYVTDEMFPLLDELVDDVVLVEEEDVRAAVRRLALQDRLVAEGAGALALAAALATPPEERGATVCLVTGASIDAGKLAPIIQGG
jgi:threonine dehydratase